MGNCLALSKPTSGSPMPKQDNIVRVAKPDGKTLEFSTPIVVKEVLEKFPAFNIGASNSKEASRPLPPDVELKAGRLYYLLPNLSCIGSCIEKGGSEGIMKRVKIVITKQQLQQLVTKQISIDEVLSKVQSSNSSSSRTVDLQSDWKPKLDSIPEGNE
ncbi:uncharacterized protein G2W53_030605 [Senna tora]|uniref:Uncharacterized protein n=1 Tax=Senna tora TaxID=362788 RepID=A0A834WER2_9FABA|nr:uncharacterized protein G2W53_030605 [Senna tora]